MTLNKKKKKKNISNALTTIMCILSIRLLKKATEFKYLYVYIYFKRIRSSMSIRNANDFLI